MPLLRYHSAMVLPYWPDEQGRPRPTYARPRRGREVPVRFRVEHLRHVGWRPFNAVSHVSWCGHGQEATPISLAAAGRVTFVPGLGEAR